MTNNSTNCLFSVVSFRLQSMFFYFTDSVVQEEGNVGTRDETTLSVVFCDHETNTLCELSL